MRRLTSGSFGVLLALASSLVLLNLNAAEKGPATSSSPGTSGVSSAERGSAAAKTGKPAKVDLNQASQQELEELPGVGPATAKAIIDARPFKSVNQLTNVTGIGTAKFAELKPLVMVKPGASSASTAATRTTQGTGSARPETAARIEKAAPGAQSATSGEISRAAGTSSNPARSTAPTTSAGRSATGERGSASSGTSSATHPDATGKVNLNTASREELESLPGIGPVKAQAIIDARPFNSVTDVMKVKGIKEGTFEEFKDRVTVR